jgi:hypothetical protein
MHCQTGLLLNITHFASCFVAPGLPVRHLCQTHSCAMLPQIKVSRLMPVSNYFACWAGVRRLRMQGLHWWPTDYPSSSWAGVAHSLSKLLKWLQLAGQGLASHQATCQQSLICLYTCWHLPLPCLYTCRFVGMYLPSSNTKFVTNEAVNLLGVPAEPPSFSPAPLSTSCTPAPTLSDPCCPPSPSVYCTAILLRCTPPEGPPSAVDSRS